MRGGRVEADGLDRGEVLAPASSTSCMRRLGCAAVLSMRAMMPPVAAASEI
jgi:hypothetical protein